MKLEIHERLVLLSLLPKEGDYEALKTLRRAHEMLSITPEEQKAVNLVNVTEGGQTGIRYDTEKAVNFVKDVPIDEYTTNLIRNALAKLDKTKKLADQHMSVYEKFIINYR